MQLQPGASGAKGFFTLGASAALNLTPQPKSSTA